MLPPTEEIRSCKVKRLCWEMPASAGWSESALRHLARVGIPLLQPRAAAREGNLHQPLALARGCFSLLSCLASGLQAPHAGHSLTVSLCFIPNSLARQRTLEDEEEQQRERRRRHRSLLSSTSMDEEPPSPVKDTSPASSRCVGSC